MLDPEWVELFVQAKKIGLSIKEIKEFFNKEHGAIEQRKSKPNEEIRSVIFTGLFEHPLQGFYLFLVLFLIMIQDFYGSSIKTL
ncbi:anti-repressor SinI family protein [Lederbergia sp. NSJ-179]|uniref:anti-repressor SinI family protein n=1 Tax=Lederbergia sp. NSJ-179 TaxID=2931402 RepID=UPI0024560D3F|nr:anti-repressor SinI family protein [Lederbergia sp. NSJ-179]